jgi:hypothetical protein
MENGEMEGEEARYGWQKIICCEGIRDNHEREHSNRYTEKNKTAGNKIKIQQ